MAGKRSIGGNPAAASESVAQSAPAAESAPKKDITLPATPDFSALWGKTEATEATPAAIPDEQLSSAEVGTGESTALREKREKMPADPFVEESKSRRFSTAAQEMARKGFLNPKKKISFRDQALIGHADLTNISADLGNKVEELRRQVPITEDGKASPMYDRIHSILDLADHHIAQAAIEHMRSHYGVDYLDAHPNMTNKYTDGVGLSQIQKMARGGAEFKNLISIPPTMPKGSIGFTARAADLLKQAAAHLTTISVQGQAAAKVNKRLVAPETFDADGAIQKQLDDAKFTYANTIDVGHKLNNPDRTAPEGTALATATSDEIKRVNTPDFLSAAGDPELGASRAADIKSMFDRRSKSGQVLAAAKKVHATIQRKIAWNAFHRIFGAKLSANEAAQKANEEFVTPTLKRNAEIRGANDYEAAKVRTLRQQMPVTPVFSDMPVAGKVAQDLSARNVSYEKTTDLPTDSLIARAKDAIDKANASGDTATAAALQGHVDSINHHTNLAKLNADPSRGAIVKEGSSTSVLRLPTEAEQIGEVGTRSHLYGNIGGPNPGVSASSLMTSSDYADRTLSDSTIPTQTVERSAMGVAANPGDAVTEITKSKESSASHPYYQKPVIDTDSSGNTFVREGKNDEAIAANTAAMQRNQRTVTDSNGNTRKEIIDQNLHARLVSEKEALFAEHRQAKADLIEAEQNGVKNKNYVGKSALARADQEFISTNQDSKSAQDKISNLKSGLVNHHTGLADRSAQALKEALVSAGAIRGRAGEVAENTGIQAAVKPEEALPSREELPYPVLPNPELSDRNRMFRRFMTTSGINPNPNEPNVVQLTDKNGRPLDYKKARKRGAVFADAALNQYAYGPTFKVPNSEEEFYAQEKKVRRAAVRGTATRESFAGVGQSVGESLKAEDQARLEQANAENEAAKAQGRSYGVPEDLLPMVTSPSNVRGLLSLGNKGSKPLVSATGKSAVVPGIGRVAIPPRKKAKKKARKGKLSAADLLPADLLEETSKQTPVVPELDVRGLLRKNSRGDAEAGLEEQDLTAAPEKLGRQFRGFQVNDNEFSETELKKMFES
jgi:hypothetical protein